MCRPGEALVAPGPRVTKQIPGLPVSLPCASAIIPRTGGQILVDQLARHGVGDIFCIPGESYLAVLDVAARPACNLILRCE
jgi:hypothetical protein